MSLWVVGLGGRRLPRRLDRCEAIWLSIRRWIVRALGSEMVLRRAMRAGSLGAGTGTGVDFVAAAAPAKVLGYANLANPRIGSTMVRSWLVS
jgi:hypothetical protein